MVTCRPMLVILMRIVAIGHFYSNGIHGAGQQIRTSTVCNSIEYYCPEDRLTKIDLVGNRAIALLKLWRQLKHNDVVLAFPGANALNVISKLLWLSKSAGKTIMIAIGGWLPQYVREKGTAFFKGLSGIYVQTEQMKSELDALGLENVTLFPNYRILRGKSIRTKACAENEKFKMVFCSRIDRNKGVYEIIEAVRMLKQHGKSNFQLDCFGPSTEEELTPFLEATRGVEEIHYLGYVDNSQIIETLSQYDVMLFPTYYEGEGFPGVVIESLIAGVPIIATDWKYNAKYVLDGETGVLCGIKDAKGLCGAVEKLYDDRALVNRMKERCSLEAEQYREEKIIAPLLQHLRLIRENLDQ